MCRQTATRSWGLGADTFQPRYLSEKGPYLEDLGNVLRLQSPDVLAGAGSSTEDSDRKRTEGEDLVGFCNTVSGL